MKIKEDNSVEEIGNVSWAELQIRRSRAFFPPEFTERISWKIPREHVSGE